MPEQKYPAKTKLTKRRVSIGITGSFGLEQVAVFNQNERRISPEYAILNKVVSLAGFQCPVGSLAIHPLHGMVEVFADDGWLRGVLYEHHEELSLAGEADDVVFAENIEMREAWVHVRELTEANLAKDIESLRKRGQLLFNTVD